MDEVRIRWDEDLPDEYVVLRGSQMAGPTLWANYEQVKIETASKDHPDGLNAICVGVGPGPADRIAAGMPYRGKWIRRSVLGRLRASGYEVYRIDHDDYPAHALLLLKDEPTGAEWVGWEALAHEFGPPEPNPHY